MWRGGHQLHPAPDPRSDRDRARGARPPNRPHGPPWPAHPPLPACPPVPARPPAGPPAAWVPTPPPPRLCLRRAVPFRRHLVHNGSEQLPVQGGKPAPAAQPPVQGHGDGELPAPVRLPDEHAPP